jgi:hypothetical protein
LEQLKESSNKAKVNIDAMFLDKDCKALVEEPSETLGIWANHKEDRKLGKDECCLEGSVWSKEPSMNHMKPIFFI